MTTSIQYVNRSEERAKEILKYYVDTVVKKASGYIEAIILVGSLSNGSYIEGEGRDIDQITILKDSTPTSLYEEIKNYISEVDRKFNRDIPISKTVYMFSETQRPFRTDMEFSVENKHLFEITIELQRVHESGIVLYGDRNIVSKLPMPSREEVVKFAEITRKMRKEGIKNNKKIANTLKNPPKRIAIQIVLTTAIRQYYYVTGQTCCNKHKIANRMKNDVGNYKFQNLLDLASRVKTNPNMIVSKEEVESLKAGCIELMKWQEDKPVDAVPLV